MAFNSTIEVNGSVVKVTLKGDLDASSATAFKDTIEKAASSNPTRLVLFMQELDFMASAGMRVLVFAKQKMGAGVSIYLIAPQAPVLNSLEMSGFHHSVYIQDTYTD